MLVRRVTQRLASSSLAAFKMQNGTAPRRTKVLTMETLNPNIKTMEYAVRGPIVTRAAEIEKELEQVGWDRLKLKLVFDYMTFYKTMLMLCYHVNNLNCRNLGIFACLICKYMHSCAEFRIKQ